MLPKCWIKVQTSHLSIDQVNHRLKDADRQLKIEFFFFFKITSTKLIKAVQN